MRRFISSIVCVMSSSLGFVALSLISAFLSAATSIPRAFASASMSLSSII